MSDQRRRRPAGAARVAATGLSVAGTVALVGVMSAAANSGSSSATGTSVGPTPDVVPPSSEPLGAPEVPTTVVVIEVHRTVYVDEHGNPIDPKAVDSIARTTLPTPGRSVVPGRTATTGTTGSTGTTRPPASAPTTSAPPATTVPPRTTAPPRCSGSNCP